MPSASKHITLAGRNVLALNRLCEPEFCWPASVIAYYAGMHLFESMYADGIIGGCEVHLNSHRLRIASAIRNRHVFGHAPVAALKSLYLFSYMARYIAMDMTHIDENYSNESRVKISGEIPLECKLPNSEKNLEEIFARLSTIIEVAKSKLTKQNYFKNFPTLVCVPSQKRSEDSAAPASTPDVKME